MKRLLATCAVVIAGIGYSAYAAQDQAQPVPGSWLNLERVPSAAEIKAGVIYDFDVFNVSGGLAAAKRILAVGGQVAVYHQGMGGGAIWGEKEISLPQMLTQLQGDIPRYIQQLGKPRALTMHIDNVHSLDAAGLGRMIEGVTGICQRAGTPCTIAMKNNVKNLLTLLQSNRKYADVINYLWIENATGDPTQINAAKEIKEKFNIPIRLIGFGKLLPGAQAPGVHETPISEADLRTFMKNNPWITDAHWAPDERHLTPTAYIANSGTTRVAPPAQPPPAALTTQPTGVQTGQPQTNPFAQPGQVTPPSATPAQGTGVQSPGGGSQTQQPQQQPQPQQQQPQQQPPQYPPPQPFAATTSSSGIGENKTKSKPPTASIKAKKSTISGRKLVTVTWKSTGDGDYDCVVTATTETSEKTLGESKNGTVKLRLAKSGKGSIDFSIQCTGEAGDASDVVTIER
jgi:hypothetical protein